ncbi:MULTISPECIES: chorismate-binding protein [unclassified Arcicella]|uniref:chorismate-binding protein n=1 Tax=unclassified Arcicella TaxID=2644986 RepID=UPI0028627685|nr:MULTISPECIES: chorismate-binding protein [unclassified Arcicella]MDR6560742.1 isochorismate synthase [Arcicella sp. BE51]MDR6810626.1 isochorismate synthase [Arcicella sp. BE140]MDR6821976.1 isochorismate synthase [Arcicella sp. BE139]
MTPTSEFHILQQTNKLAKLWQTAFSEGFPMALWQLPQSTEKQLIIDLSGSTQRKKTDLDELPAGFVMSPFQGESLFLKGDLYYRFDTNNHEIEDDIKGKTLEAAIFEKKYLHYSDEETIEPSAAKQEEDISPKHSLDSSLEKWNGGLYNEMIFAEMVSKAIIAIENGEMQKVVLSRTKNVTLPESFEIIDAFQKLCKAYPNAFISLVYLPEFEAIWLGATPETLVSVDGQGIFKTMSLAGTQSAIGDNGEMLSPISIRWSHKEIEEQAFVSRYVIECFKKIRLREYCESGPKTVQAGNLMHLRTDFKVDTKALNFPQLGTVMLELLHPTSAVCGMPKEPALRLIAETELHHREFYSGFLGPVNIKDESHLFVNLRTVKIQGNHATFFAGCGITADSNPVKEWYETEMKSQTLMNVIL